MGRMMRVREGYDVLGECNGTGFAVNVEEGFGEGGWRVKKMLYVAVVVAGVLTGREYVFYETNFYDGGVQDGVGFPYLQADFCGEFGKEKEGLRVHLGPEESVYHDGEK